MPSLLTLNIFRTFSSFPIVDFKQVNFCWGNYVTFYSFNICFIISTGGMQDLRRRNARNSVIFLISHIQQDVSVERLRLLNNSIREQWKVYINATTKFWWHSKKAEDCHQSIASNHFPFLEIRKMDAIKSLTLNKMFMISIKYID